VSALLLLGSQDLNDEFSKLSAHEARQRLAVLLHRMDTNGDLLISQQEISDWVLKSFRYVCICWQFLEFHVIAVVFLVAFAELLGRIAVPHTYMQPIVTDRVAWFVGRSVCLSVCLSQS